MTGQPEYVGGQEASCLGTDKTEKDEHEPQVHWSGMHTAEKSLPSAQKPHRHKANYAG